MRKITLTTAILPNHEVHIPVPDDLPVGRADIVVLIEPHVEPTYHTFGELAEAEFFGMWKDRTDIGNSVEFAHKSREESWKRHE